MLDERPEYLVLFPNDRGVISTDECSALQTYLEGNCPDLRFAVISDKSAGLDDDYLVAPVLGMVDGVFRAFGNELPGENVHRIYAAIVAYGDRVPN